MRGPLRGRSGCNGSAWRVFRRLRVHPRPARRIRRRRVLEFQLSALPSRGAVCRLPTFTGNLVGTGGARRRMIRAVSARCRRLPRWRLSHSTDSWLVSAFAWSSPRVWVWTQCSETPRTYMSFRSLSRGGSAAPAAADGAFLGARGLFVQWYWTSDEWHMRRTRCCVGSTHRTSSPAEKQKGRKRGRLIAPPLVVIGLSSSVWPYCFAPSSP